MNLKTLKKKQARLSDQLSLITKEIQKKELIGYRAFNFGDQYDYGTYADFLFKKSKYLKESFLLSKKEALERAKEFDSYEPIYVETPPFQGRIH